MYIQVFDLQTLTPVANLTTLASGSCNLLHNESGQATATVLVGSNEIAPLVMTDGRFDLDKVLRAPSLWMAHVRDGADGNLRMQGRLVIEPSDDDNYYIVTVSDLLDELRMISLPPQRFFNGLMTDVIEAILAFMPPASRRRDAPRPTTDFFVNERWELLDASEAVNGWTSLEGSNMTCLEAIIAVCDATGNNFRLNYDQTRNMRGLVIYDQPSGRDRPRANITLGGFHAKESADYNINLIGQPTMVIENDTVLAGMIPEGGSYQDPDSITRILRLTGEEEVPKGYRLENLHGYWGIFNESLVGTPVSSTLPAGQIRTDAFGAIMPMVNTQESVSAVVERLDDRHIYSASFAGHKQNHWKDAEVSFGEKKTKVLSSSGNVILLEERLPLTVNDIISVEVFREWDEEKVKDSRQSLTGAAVAVLQSNEKVLVTWKVRIPSPPWRLRLADYVRLIYSGAVQVRNWQSGVTRFVGNVSLSDVFVITAIEIVQDENGIEYQDLTLAERMWRFPSSSGLREIMALIQRRMPGVRMGREGAAVIGDRVSGGDGRAPETGVPTLIGDSDIAWGTGSGQVSAADVPIADNGGFFTAGDVEGALQELGAALTGAAGTFTTSDGKTVTVANGLITTIEL